ncbi:MAG: hypothetical protein JNG85_10620 [Spirochaetaceae bacterium]|nr:hypothetical protein [Spirochaetaceae bacterium]
MTVRLCSVCGRLNLADFRYCPYCGEAAAKGEGSETELSKPGAAIAVPPPEGGVGAAGRFAELRRDLDALEADMDALVEEGSRRGAPAGERADAPLPEER